MSLKLLRIIYNLLLPLVLLLGVAPWVIKMLKRGGFGTGLLERIGIYREELDFEPTGVVYIHAVSVGEVLIALKLIETWLEEHPEDTIVLAPTTATGHAVAVEKAPEVVRVIYAPIDFPWVLGKMFRRFEPKQFVFMESEVWPNLLVMASARGIPITVANARLSPRSEKRYQKLGGIVARLFALFDRGGVQEEGDVLRWSTIGVRREAIVVTGSIKFDQSGAVRPRKRTEFQSMLDSFGVGRKVLMALSTDAGVEKLIAEQCMGGEGLPVIVPRHAERREEGSSDLTSLGVEVVGRSQFSVPKSPENAVLVIDSTGELRDWTAHADIAVVGKSFLGKGGQNPTEAIAAKVPVIVGPHMENFEPLVSMLIEAEGIWSFEDAGEIRDLVPELLHSDLSGNLQRAIEVLDAHQGATDRTVENLRVS
jgi:3-deoxy-D-manno-octulosonic-acid transferase